MITPEMLLAAIASLKVRHDPMAGNVAWVCGYLNLATMADHLNLSAWRDVARGGSGGRLANRRMDRD